MMTQRQPRTMDGYIRVSRRMGRDGPGYISPTVQREAIQRWADYRDIRIAEWQVDEDESGGTQDRPGLRRIMERIRAGETDGIACWRLNRFARNVAGAVADVEIIQNAGGVLAFVEEDIDPTGPFGDFILKVLLAVSELELNNVKAGWKTAKSRAVARGVHIGPAPFGYVARDDGTLKVNEPAGPVVTEAFAIAARDGLPATVAFLRERAPERTWTTSTTRRFLANSTYLGGVRYGDDVCHGSHPALVTRVIFEAAQHDVGQRRAPNAEFPLTGIASCGSCGGRLVGGRGGPDKRRMYRCASRCKAPVATSAVPLETHVVSELRAAFEHPGFRVGTETGDVTAAETALLEAETELDQFASDVTARKLLKHRYHEHLESRVNAVDEARQQLREAMAATNDARVVVPAELWADLTPTELAEVLRAGLERIVVRRGRGPVADRVSVVAKGMNSPALAGAQDA